MFDGSVSEMAKSDLGETRPLGDAVSSVPAACGDAGREGDGRGDDRGDDGLLLQVAEGDRRAFALLMDRHIDRAYGVARRVLGNRSDAEDVVQDSFLKVWQKAGQWQPGRAQFSTWLYRVVVNRCLDLKRKPKGTGLDQVAEQSDDRPDALEDMEARERQARIAAAVAELPERQRAAIALSYTAGLSNAAAAESLQISVKAFESLLVRAKRELRAKLAEDARDGLAEDGEE